MSLDSVNGSDDRSLLILYATETGNAQDVADRIARHCRRIHFRCRVLSVDVYPMEEMIHEHLIIFVVSTTGTGQEPRSMTPLWSALLRSDLPPDLFEDLNFAIFGLGDTAYEKFCWPAKLLERRLESLGAVRICAIGEGDDQHRLGLDGALVPWIFLLSETLLSLYPLPPGLQPLSPDLIPPARVSFSSAPQPHVNGRKDPLDEDENYCRATVKCNRRITAEDWWQDVRHLEFAFKDSIDYSPGDVALINPIIPDSEVDEVLAALGWTDIADEPYCITSSLNDQTLPSHLPPTITLRTILSRLVNFNDVPRRSFFEFLRYFVKDEMEKEKIDEFLSDEGADDLYEYTHLVRRTIREVFTEFRSAKIPKEYVFDIFPAIRLRQFSIASSVKKHPNEIHLCIAIVTYRTRLRVPRKGVATSYIATLKPGDTLPIGIQRGPFKLPQDLDTPVICVGPGTGVAPMRAVLEERISSGAKANTLYFGCRSSSKDEHYAAEWAAYASSGALTYRVAHSRDGGEGKAREYVQHLIEEDGERVWEEMGRRDGYMFISGSANKMPAAVRAALQSAAQKAGGMGEAEAKAWVVGLEREGRVVEDCWS